MRPQRATGRARAALLTAGLLLSAILYFGFASTKSGPPAAAGAEVLPPVVVIPAVGETGYRAERRYLGRVQALSAADLSFEVGGKLIEVGVAEGSGVKAGDVLARLGTARLANRRDTLRAELEEAEALALLAAERRRRLTGLSAIGAASTQALEGAVAEAEATAARIDRINSTLASAERDLDDAVLRAPFAGVVAARQLDPGTVITPGQPVLRLVGEGRLEAIVGIPPDKALQLGAGDEIPFAIGERTGRARVIAIGDEVERRTGTVPLRLALPGDLAASPGETVHALLTEEQEADGFWLPATALMGSYRGLWTVFVVVPDTAEGQGLARRESVSVLHAKGDKAYVAGTLEEGALVVAEAPFKLVPGQRVTYRQGAGASLTEARLSAP